MGRSRRGISGGFGLGGAKRCHATIQRMKSGVRHLWPELLSAMLAQPERERFRLAVGPAAFFRTKRRVRHLCPKAPAATVALFKDELPFLLARLFVPDDGPHCVSAHFANASICNAHLL